MKPLKLLSALILIASALLLSGVKNAIAQPSPSPSNTNNYYYSGNWYYDTRRPIPGKCIEQDGKSANQADQVTKPLACGPNSSASDLNGGKVTDKNKGELQVKIVSDIPIQRDLFDCLSLLLSFLLLVYIIRQLGLLRKAYIADHRPWLLIRHVAFMTKEDDIFVIDDQGSIKHARADFSFVVSNRGASKSTIFERNITLKSVGRADGMEDILRELRQHELPLPERDKETGRPVYDPNGTSEEQFNLEPDEERVLRLSRVSRSTQDAVDMYLTLSAKRGTKHMRFFALGYFRYRDQTGRKHTTAFCRLYDTGKDEFVSVVDSKYEYRT
jgi:hypothetical protein